MHVSYGYACSPAALACTMARKSWEQRRSPSPPATPSARYRFCRTMAPTFCAAHRRTRCISARRCAIWASTPRRFRCAPVFSVRSPGRSRCARRSSGCSPSVLLIFTGLSEIAGPGVACECQLQNGLHINEDMFYPEIIDPDTGETLPDGRFTVSWSLPASARKLSR